MNGQRFSRQREQIYRAVQCSSEHPSAQMVYDALKPEMPRLSLGTVYRNLHQMAQEGRLTELDGPSTRFDATVYPHPHIRCQCCGRVEDVKVAYDAALDRRVSAEKWQVTGHSLIFCGICPACAETF